MNGELLTAALLGTDRHPPPVADHPAVADLVADAAVDAADDPTAAGPARRLLTTIAAAVVAERAGQTPRAALPFVIRAASDDRPLLPVAAARRWTQLRGPLAALRPEYLAAATAAGWRPSADVLVAMLGWARGSVRHHRAVLAFGDPLASWLLDLLPDLGLLERATGEHEQHQPVPPEIVTIFETAAERPADFAAHLVAGIGDGSYRWAHRGVLSNAVVSAPVAVLAAAAEQLTQLHDDALRLGDSGGPVALCAALLELVTTRRAMLTELQFTGDRR